MGDLIKRNKLSRLLTLADNRIIEIKNIKLCDEDSEYGSINEYYVVVCNVNEYNVLEKRYRMVEKIGYIGKDIIGCYLKGDDIIQWES